MVVERLRAATLIGHRIATSRTQIQLQTLLRTASRHAIESVQWEQAVHNHVDRLARDCTTLEAGRLGDAQLPLPTSLGELHALSGAFSAPARPAIAIAASLLGRRRLWPQSARGFRANLDYLSATEFIFDVNHRAIRKVAMVIHCH